MQYRMSETQVGNVNGSPNRGDVNLVKLILLKCGFFKSVY